MTPSESRYLANPVVSRRDEADGTRRYDPDVDDVAVTNGRGVAAFASSEGPRTLSHVAAFIAAA